MLAWIVWRETEAEAITRESRFSSRGLKFLKHELGNRRRKAAQRKFYETLGKVVGQTNQIIWKQRFRRMQKKKRKSCLLLQKVTISYLAKERGFWERAPGTSLSQKTCWAFDQHPKKKKKGYKEKKETCTTTGLSDWARESMLLHSRTKIAPGRHGGERERGAGY